MLHQTQNLCVFIFNSNPLIEPSSKNLTSDHHTCCACFCLCQAIADMVTEENLAEGRLYPPLSTIREVSFKIAVKVRDVILNNTSITYFHMQLPENFTN